MISINPEKQKIKLPFILTVFMIYPLPQAAIDLYLPSWPAMVQALHTTNQLLQVSLVVYIFFLGIAQLIYGSLSDRWGRKPVLLFGIGLFLLSSVVCAFFVTSVRELIIWRAVQGLGMGAGFTIASAILSDTFKGKQLAQCTSYSAMVYSMAIIFAPTVGGYLQHYAGWQSNFLVMAIYAFLLWISIYFFVFETRQQEKNSQVLSFYGTAKNYLQFFTKTYFMGNVICLLLAYGIMIAFSTIGPFLLQDILGVSPITYGKLLLLIGFSYFLGAFINSRLLKFFSIHKMITLGLGLMLIASIGLWLAGVWNYTNVITITGFSCLGLLGVGFVYPNCFAKALEVFPAKSYTSAFIGSIILIGVSTISALIAHYSLIHKSSLSYVFLILTIASIASYLLTILINEQHT